MNTYTIIGGLLIVVSGLSAPKCSPSLPDDDLSFLRVLTLARVALTVVGMNLVWLGYTHTVFVRPSADSLWAALGDHTGSYVRFVAGPFPIIVGIITIALTLNSLREAYRLIKPTG